jgi:hypothetical protein
MTVRAFTRKFTTERTFIEYAPEQFEELAEYFRAEHSVILEPVETFPDRPGKYGLIKFQSMSGSTSHYIHPYQFIVIDEHGEVRGFEEKDEENQ